MSKKGDSSKTESTTIALLSFSIFIATANQIMYKQTLNAFSSPHSNYGFFVNQFSSAMYTVQAVVVSGLLVWREPGSLSEALRTPQSVFLWMGVLDGASSTLATMSGAFCPGELQTILNQSIIPMTMVTSALFIQSKFKGFQLWGACLIITGAVAASSDYFLGDDNDDGAGDEGSGSRHNTGAIFIFILSILPSAWSNVYKEKTMKEGDMNEVCSPNLNPNPIPIPVPIPIPIPIPYPNSYLNLNPNPNAPCRYTQLRSCPSGKCSWVSRFCPCWPCQPWAGCHRVRWGVTCTQAGCAFGMA